VPKRAKRPVDDYDDEEPAPRRPQRRPLILRAIAALLPTRISDTVAMAVATAAVSAVVVNAVAFQDAPRTPEPVHPRLGITNLIPPSAPNPQRRPVDAPPARNMNELIQNIQKELSTRGYYNGAVDGVPGPRTDQAIRDFQKGRGQNTLEPSDSLLHQIRNSPAKTDVTGSIEEADASRKSLRVLSLQRTLARLGYGPVRLSGTYGSDTKAAIERFERDWMLPVTGLMSTTVYAKLAAVSGTPVE
jgi:hypothetical protein